MNTKHGGATAVYSATLGALSFDSLLIARTPWSRLRGWYGFHHRQAGIDGLDAVLLTRTKSIHTLAMKFSLDVLWLDANMCCIGWQLDVRPWRCCWHSGATHVLELQAVADIAPLLSSVLQQPLIIVPPK